MPWTSDRRAQALSNCPYPALDAGGWQSLFADEEGVPYAFGSNMAGQLGLGDVVKRLSPVAVKVSNDTSAVTTVAGGYFHSFYVDSSGVLYGMGQNIAGQLGVGDTVGRNSPVKVTTGIKLVAGGEAHSLCVDEAGVLYTFGGNQYGQLGLGDTQFRLSPTRVNTLNYAKVIAISAGEFFSLYLDEAGDLVGFGFNGYGMLCFPDLQDRWLPTKIMGPVSLMAAGRAHLMAAGNWGLYVCGNNRFGQLGTGNIVDQHTPYQVLPSDGSSTPVTYVAAGELTSFYVSNGALYGTGFNYYGQLGLGDTSDRLSFTQVSTVPLNTVKAIAVGANHAVYIDTLGSLYSFGRGMEGSLGVNSTLDSSVPVKVPGHLVSHV